MKIRAHFIYEKSLDDQMLNRLIKDYEDIRDKGSFPIEIINGEPTVKYPDILGRILRCIETRTAIIESRTNNIVSYNGILSFYGFVKA